MKRNNDTKDVILELVAVAFLGSGGIFVRICGLSPINCGFYRALFSLPILFPFAYKKLHLLKLRDVLILLAAGIFFAGDIALCNIAFNYTSVANVSMLTNLTPLIIVPVSYFAFKERVPRFFLVGAVIAILGVVVLIGGKADPSEANYLGDMLSLCACAFYATFLLIAYRMRDGVPSSVIMFVSGIGSLIALFAASTFAEGFQIPRRSEDILPLIGYTLCMQVIGQNLLTHCQGKVSVNLSSIICLMQPVFSAIYSWIIFEEKLSLMEIAGIVIVAAGVYLVKLQYTGKTQEE